MDDIPSEAELIELIYSDQIDELFSRCNSLAENGSVDALTVLLLALRDDNDYFHEMSILLHASERAPAANVYRAIRNCLVRLDQNAPDWCKTIVKRHLLVDDSNSPRFSVSEFVIALEGNSSARQIVRQIAVQLSEVGQIPTNVLDNFC